MKAYYMPNKQSRGGKNILGFVKSYFCGKEMIRDFTFLIEWQLIYVISGRMWVMSEQGST